MSGIVRSWMLRWICSTWRVRCHGLDRLDQRLDTNQALILVFWHSKYLCLLPLLRDRRANVFTSVSRRGDVIRGVLERFGFVAIQLPNHGGDRSLKIMRDALADGSPGAIAVDGPLGPAHQVHRGAVQLASELGHQLVPASVVSSSRFIMKSRWDQLEFPYPFSRVSLAIGEPIAVPPHVNDESISAWSRIVANALESTEGLALRQLLDDRPSIR